MSELRRCRVSEEGSRNPRLLTRRRRRVSVFDPGLPSLLPHVTVGVPRESDSTLWAKTGVSRVRRLLSVRGREFSRDCDKILPGSGSGFRLPGVSCPGPPTVRETSFLGQGPRVTEGLRFFPRAHTPFFPSPPTGRVTLSYPPVGS